ncbi:ricin-type beta-trefoil lectin domain protein [Streptomyces sp. NPDC059076]|uniref:ricin-type beta-trefoil lectin domain protein n=1 Tax=unclassified Streptomyces TaxID=2593676 RepID=UPI0036CBFD8B
MWWTQCLHRARARASEPWALGLLVAGALLGTACSPGAAPVPRGPHAAAADFPPPNPPRCRRTLVAVAHPDDDVFFVNPEVRRTIRAGCSVDTVYLTAGDGGKPDRSTAVAYADRPQYGVRAAYAEMAEADNRWKRADVDAGGRRLRSYLLDDRSRTSNVRLTFLDLHDGLPQGKQKNSLLRLFRGDRRSIETFRGDGSYTEDQVLATVTTLVRQSRAERILTLDHDNASFAFGLGGKVDHSDHGVGARYLRRVGYALGVPVSSYLGYTMSPLKANLSPGAVAEKDEVARWYIANRTCRATGTCANVTPFKGPLQKDWDLWIHRQYQRTHRAPRPGEILGDIGRTTFSTGRDPEQCLHAATGPQNTGAVGIRACDGSGAQKWDMGPDSTIRPRLDRGSCLTALPPAVGLQRCEHGHPSQQWTREPWRSATWKRAAWRISGSGHRCLYQDDRRLPARWDDRDQQSPELRLSDCGTLPRPELYWRWGG